MKVELIDLKSRYIEEKEDLLRCIKRVLKKGSFVLTEELNKFESSICNYTGSKYCLGLNSGTDALMMSLWALNIKKGDEVITSPTSFIASIGAIIHIGAKPVLVDIDNDLNLNADNLENAITKKTKAIMPVHWAGKICNMKKIKKISRKYKIPIVEDAAQGMGAYLNNKHAGTFGEIAAFSTHPLKNLGALGDGGFIITNNKSFKDKINLFRNHGLKGRDNVEIFGINSRLDSLHAEILKFRLSRLKKTINKRNYNLELYKKYLDTDKVILPNIKANETHALVMLLALCDKRDQLKEYLDSYNIQTLIYYGTPLHLHKASKILDYKKGNFPNSEYAAQKVLALPHHQGLNTDKIKYVCEKINKFYSN